MEHRSTGESRHLPTSESARINRAVERATKDTSFIDSSLWLSRDFRFPAYKHSIVNYLKQIGAPDDVVALFESLDGYIEYRDLHHLQKALEQSNSQKKIAITLKSFQKS